MRKKNLLFLLINVMMPLIIGAVIYFSFRNDNILMFSWFTFCEEIILFLRNLTNNLSLPEWVIYSLPQGLWVYSLTVLLMYIWKEETIKTKINIILLITIFSLGGELGQFFGFFSGTFCWNDVVVVIMGIIFGVLISYIERKYINEKF